MRATIKMLKTETALGIDLWEVLWLKQLPGWGLQTLADLLVVIEAKMSWPVTILVNFIVLVGKPKGVYDP